VHEVLKGAIVDALPVEQPPKFEFVINLQNGEANRPHGSAQRAGKGRQGDSLMPQKQSAT